MAEIIIKGKTPGMEMRDEGIEDRRRRQRQQDDRDIEDILRLIRRGNV